MEVKEVKQRAKNLKITIYELIRDFEKETEMEVESIDISRVFTFTNSEICDISIDIKLN
jgi:hypothetical protein